MTQRLDKMADDFGVPFKFICPVGNRYICKSLFSDGFAACAGEDGSFYLFESRIPLYSRPTESVYPYLVECRYERDDITPILRLSFRSPEEAEIYCIKHDYKILKMLPEEKIDAPC